MPIEDCWYLAGCLMADQGVDDAAFHDLTHLTLSGKMAINLKDAMSMVLGYRDIEGQLPVPVA